MGSDKDWRADIDGLPPEAAHPPAPPRLVPLVPVRPDPADAPVPVEWERTDMLDLRRAPKLPDDAAAAEWMPTEIIPVRAADAALAGSGPPRDGAAALPDPPPPPRAPDRGRSGSGDLPRPPAAPDAPASSVLPRVAAARPSPGPGAEPAAEASAHPPPSDPQGEVPGGRARPQLAVGPATRWVPPPRPSRQPSPRWQRDSSPGFGPAPAFEASAWHGSGPHPQWSPQTIPPQWVPPLTDTGSYPVYPYPPPPDPQAWTHQLATLGAVVLLLASVALSVLVVGVGIGFTLGHSGAPPAAPPPAPPPEVGR